MDAIVHVFEEKVPTWEKKRLNFEKILEEPVGERQGRQKVHTVVREKEEPECQMEGRGKTVEEGYQNLKRSIESKGSQGAKTPGAEKKMRNGSGPNFLCVKVELKK